MAKKQLKSMVWPLVAIALGILGLYLLSPNNPKCPNCKSIVPKNSPKCQSCGAPLGWRV